ncbi:hypothetical protein TrLO_g5014 [Triparma laevis f. longispina]|uniref:Uncharacterized protein n=2 Tax=Triparma laevis TaxID=1534972 RepID=A0A9W7CGF0_9STRA|nr:hypothetical protein TrLO_g5014 [Triparma laevis f. longispina]
MINALFLLVVLLASVSSLQLSSSSINRGPLGSASSSFGRGSTSAEAASATSQRPFVGFERGMVEMKKGKPNVPPMMRSQYKQQQQMNSMKEQMMAANEVGADGIPVFNMFVKSGKTGGSIWYPCGSFKGDERTKALVESMKGGFLSGMAKNQLDNGVKNSLFDSQKQLVESITRSYPQLRKSRDDLKWGYKITANGLSDEQKEINEVVPEKQSGNFFDNISNMFNN